MNEINVDLEALPIGEDAPELVNVVVEIAKNGSPTETRSSPNSKKIGLPSEEGAQSLLGTARGRTRIGDRTTSRCKIAWRREPSHVVVACT